MTKTRVFWFHINKPETKRTGRPVWSLHYNGACHQVDSIDCLAPVQTKTNKMQPIAVVRGRTHKVSFMKTGNGTRIAFIHYG